MADGLLIAQSLRGTPEAFVEVVRRHEVAIHAYLVRRAGHQAADDLLGEVWVRAFGARHGYVTSHEDARPWLYGIARTFCEHTGELARTETQLRPRKPLIPGMTLPTGSTRPSESGQ